MKVLPAEGRTVGLRAWFTRKQIEGAINLAVHAQAMFLATDNPKLLETSLMWYRRAVALTGASDPDLADRLSNLGDLLCMKYERSRRSEDLDEALATHRAALALVHDAHPHRFAVYTGMGSVLSHVAQRDHDADLLDEAIAHYRAGLADVGDDQDLHAMRLVNLGRALQQRTIMRSDRSALDEAIEVLQRAVDLTPRDSAFYAWRAARLASAITGRAALAGDADPTAGAAELIAHVRDALPTALPGFAQQSRILMAPLLSPPAVPQGGQTPSLEEISAMIAGLDADQLQIPYSLTTAAGMTLRAVDNGDLRLFDEAVAMVRDAVAKAPPGHPMRPMAMAALGWSLGQRMEWLGTGEDLPEAVEALREAARTVAADDENRGGYLSDLGNALILSYEQDGDPALLAEAVEALREAVRLFDNDRPEIRVIWTSLGGALFRQFQHFGTEGALDGAVEAHRAAAISPSDPNFALYAGNLTGALLLRFRNAGNVVDLDEAIAQSRQAASAPATPRASQPILLANLAEGLTFRATVTGQADGFREAIAVLRECLAAMPGNHIGRSRALHMLGNALLAAAEDEDDAARAQALSSEAVEALREAVALERPGSPHRPGLELALGTALVRNVSFTEVDQRTHRIIAALLRTISQPESQPAMPATDFGGVSRTTARKLGEAIGTMTRAVESMPATAPERPQAVGNLGSMLWIRSRLTGYPDHLDLAERVLRQAASQPMPGGAYAVTLSFLGRALIDQWRRNGSEEARTSAEQTLDRATEVDDFHPGFRAFVAKQLAEFVVETGRLDAAAAPYAKLVGLLDAVAWRGLPRADQERMLGQFENVAVEAAACGLAAGRSGLAVELLEEGRGVLLTQLINGQSAYDRIRSAQPVLADRLRHIDDELARLRIGVPPGVGALPAPADTPYPRSLQHPG